MIIPQFGSLLTDLKEITPTIICYLAQMAAAAPPPQKRVNRDVNTRSQTLVGVYQLPQIIPFLRGISYNLARF